MPSPHVTDAATLVDRDAQALRAYLDDLYEWSTGGARRALRPVGPRHPSNPGFYEGALVAISGWEDKNLRHIAADAVLCEILRWCAMGPFADLYEAIDKSEPHG